MKILVFSDTHGKTDVMKNIVSRYRDEVSLVIHLGDCYRDFAEVMRDFPLMANLSVLGNCDFAPMHPGLNYEGIFKVEDRRIFYTHGHKYNVNNGYEYIVSNARLKGADVVLFGHTHIAVNETVGSCSVINPGSLSHSRSDRAPSYALIEICKSNLKCQIKEIQK